jgi:recombinational DNA repair protein RecT
LKLLLSKYGVLSVEMQRAITLDQGVVVETPEGEVVEFPDGPSEEATPVIPATETEPGFIATRALFPEEESTDPIHPT